MRSESPVMKGIIQINKFKEDKPLWEWLVEKHL